ncbi:hypothetical protein SCUCBS95973_001561 [Sporothrix curviconia]|uniref:Uncharacterized protein n=1 Tax=Sporothrix curviconia TaxID=1260050 RepID=A0ABP0AZM1_9PEZI
MLLACLVFQIMSATASPVMSCAHNTTSKPSSLPASTTPAGFVETPRSWAPPSSTPNTPFTVPAMAAGVIVPPSDAPAPAPPAASITQAPQATRKGQADKFVQTTYYSCVTMGTYTHCGWHEPILDASTSAASGSSSQWSRPAVLCLAFTAAVISCL